MKDDSQIKDILPAELFLREKLQYKHNLYSMSYNPHRKEIMNTSDKGKALDWTPLRHGHKDQIHGNQDSLAEHSQNYLFFFFPLVFSSCPWALVRVVLFFDDVLVLFGFVLFGFLFSFPALALFKGCFAVFNVKLSFPLSKWKFCPDIKCIIIKLFFSSNEPFPPLINLYTYGMCTWWILGSYYMLCCDLAFLGQKDGILNEKLVRA